MKHVAASSATARLDRHAIFRIPALRRGGAGSSLLVGAPDSPVELAAVSFYRRFTNVSGKQSFSTLYTAINVLAGHYTSYGPKFPVPEKRRKRLFQEYAEVEKNIKKRR